MAVKKPLFKLTYNNRDISRQIDHYLKSITYIDRTLNESDELEIQLDDSSGKWANAWYPDQGAKLVFSFGYQGELVPAGEFEIDQVNLTWDSRGRSVTIKALSAITSKAMRTKREQAYENISLRVLAETVASRLKMEVTGKIDSIMLERETQDLETDLGFLSRVAGEHGYVFSIKSGKLVFTKQTSLLARTAIDSIGPDRVRSLNLYDTTGRTFRVASHRHFDARKGRSIKYSTKPQEGVVGDDEDISEGYVENKGQAELRAEAKRLRITESQVRASVALHTGVPKLVAGSNVTLKGFGKRNGKYAIESSTHTITSNGYVTDIEIYSIDL